MNDNLLILILKTKYFNMIRDGKKNHEYRVYKPFWVCRIKNQKEIMFRLGYTSERWTDIMAKIISIKIISFNDLPKYAQKEFSGMESERFFDIFFTNVSFMGRLI